MEQLKCKKMRDYQGYTGVYSFCKFTRKDVCYLQVKQLKRIMHNEKTSTTEIFTRMCSM